MEEKIKNRILKKLNDPGLLKKLTHSISKQDLNSLLLYLFDIKVKEMTPANLMRNYRNNAYGKPSDDDPVKIRKLDLLAFKMLGKSFEPVELSPVIPLGSCSVIATVNQKNVLSALRDTEVIADVTNALELEIARRRIGFVRKGRDIEVF